jgi:spore germination protein GerM
MLRFFGRWLTPFNIIALLFLGGVAAFRWFQERPLAIGIAPEITEFIKGPQRPALNLKLYFAAVDGRNFAIESRNVRVEGETLGHRAEATVREWLKGPTAQGALPLVPRDSAPPGVFARKDGIVLDLPKTWAKLRLGRSVEWLYACGLTNTLLELQGVKNITFLSEGKPLETLAGHVSTRTPFTAQECK